VSVKRAFEKACSSGLFNRLNLALRSGTSGGFFVKERKCRTNLIMQLLCSNFFCQGGVNSYYSMIRNSFFDVIHFSIYPFALKGEYFKLSPKLANGHR
jgi:hypothetical protein